MSLKRAAAAGRDDDNDADGIAATDRRGPDTAKLDPTNSIDVGPTWVVNTMLSYWVQPLSPNHAGRRLKQVTLDALKFAKIGVPQQIVHKSFTPTGRRLMVRQVGQILCSCKILMARFGIKVSAQGRYLFPDPILTLLVLCGTRAHRPNSPASVGPYCISYKIAPTASRWKFATTPCTLVELPGRYCTQVSMRR